MEPMHKREINAVAPQPASAYSQAVEVGGASTEKAKELRSFMILSTGIGCKVHTLHGGRH